MNATKIISFILAIMAAVLIAMAGKSCAKDIAQQNASHRNKNTTEAPSFHLITESPYGNTPATVPHLVDDSGQAIQPGEDGAEATTEREYVTVTDMFGDVVETIPVTTPEEADIPTTTLSILDAYNAEHGTEAQAAATTEYVYGTVNENITIEIN